MLSERVLAILYGVSPEYMHNMSNEQLHEYLQKNNKKINVWGQKYRTSCSGICVRFAADRKHLYSENRKFCKHCDAWLFVYKLLNKNKCPCCNKHLRNKSRHRNGKLFT